MRLSLFTLCCFLALGCQESGSGDKFRVAVTTTLLADIVNNVGGEHVAVATLMGPGIDPHRYTASPSDIRKLSDCQLILYHGLHLEGKMVDILAKSPPRRSVAVCEGIDGAKLLKAEGGEGLYDPHVWMNPTLWTGVVGTVRDELCRADPAHTEAYTRNAQDYIERILKADEDNRQLFRSLAPERSILVTSHDAFEYFGKHYGLTVRGLQGISTAAETSTKDVSELADFLGTKKVPAVFAETSVPPKGLQAVLDAVEKKYNHTVKLVGGDRALYSDALGETGTPGETYIGMMKHNVSVIVNALK